ncbi:MAG: radical SAM protein [Pseudohaliea sp.]
MDGLRQRGAADDLALASSRERVGDHDAAARIYERLLAADPGDVALRTRLAVALLAAGQLARGEQEANRAWSLGAGMPATADLPRRAGLELFGRGYREQARPWLRLARTHSPADRALRDAWERCQAPAYLAPEVYDPVAGETLLRYAPREADRYVYAIDIVGTCNLRCPSCPVANSDDSHRPKGTMPEPLFLDILAKVKREAPGGRAAVWLYNWGEPLLHPALDRIIGAVRGAGLPSMISTNLNYDRGLERLAGNLPDVIKVSLSGWHPDSYQRSHTGGDIDRVKHNLERLRAIVAESPRPCRVWVGQHLYRHNYHERDEVRSACEALGFEWQPVQAFWQPLEKLLQLVEGRNIADPLYGELLVDPVRNAEHVRRHRRKAYDCELRFNQTVINVDGSVSLCCATYAPENRIAGSFLTTAHEDLEAARYRHALCGRCRGAGLDYSISELPETIVASR